MLTRPGSDRGGSQTEFNSQPAIDHKSYASSTSHPTDRTESNSQPAIGHKSYASSTLHPTDIPDTRTAKRMLLLPSEVEILEALMKADEGETYAIYSDSQGVLAFGISYVITEDDPEYGKPVGISVSEDRVREAFLADLDNVLEDVQKVDKSIRHV